MTDAQQQILCDPQTSGGLLVAVSPAGKDEFLDVARQQQLELTPIGQLRQRHNQSGPLITVL
jgi:selenide,water dikinase